MRFLVLAQTQGAAAFMRYIPAPLVPRPDGSGPLHALPAMGGSHLWRISCSLPTAAHP